MTSITRFTLYAILLCILSCAAIVVNAIDMDNSGIITVILLVVAVFSYTRLLKVVDEGNGDITDE